MVSLLLIALAAMCNAIMDNISHHFYKSILNTNRLSRRYWDLEVSNKLPIIIPYTGYKMDAWHNFKSLMIVLMCLSVVVYKPFIDPIIDFIIAGCVWNLTFNLFYNKILNKF